MRIFVDEKLKEVRVDFGLDMYVSAKTDGEVALAQSSPISILEDSIEGSEMVYETPTPKHLPVVGETIPPNTEFEGWAYLVFPDGFHSWYGSPSGGNTGSRPSLVMDVGSQEGLRTKSASEVMVFLATQAMK